ncbi:MAG: P27 family phage terminase small subunit [Oscillospiraceae bacterium]|nr:P27 family phage terminase small subunit [Oscillospiraceae bacterium]
MPTAAKSSENMTKHLTRADLEARQMAEAETLPRRQKPRLKKPGFISGSRQANAYWNQILKRMEGLALLDDLDSEMLAGYCSMLARRDQTILLIAQLMDRLGVSGAVDDGKSGMKKASAMTDEEWEASATKAQMTSDELIEAVSKLDSLNGKLQSLDRTLLQYAEKLGLTPSGRVRLAQKRAQAAMEPEPDNDLFGD